MSPHWRSLRCVRLLMIRAAGIVLWMNRRSRRLLLRRRSNLLRMHLGGCGRSRGRRLRCGRCVGIR